MKTRLLIIILVSIISIFLFLQAPSFFGQPECNDEIDNRESDCSLWNNWQWIEYELLHCWQLNTTKTIWPSAYQKIGCV